MVTIPFNPATSNYYFFGWKIIYISPILFFPENLILRILLTLILGLIYLFLHIMALGYFVVGWRVFKGCLTNKDD